MTKHWLQCQLTHWHVCCQYQHSNSLHKNNLFLTTNLRIHFLSILLTSVLSIAVSSSLFLSVCSCEPVHLRPYCSQAAHSTKTGFDSWQRPWLFFLSKTSSRQFSGYRGQSGRGLKLTAHLLAAPRLRINEAVSSLSAWTGTTVHFLLYISFSFYVS